MSFNLYADDSFSRGFRKVILDNGLVLVLKQKNYVPLVHMRILVKAGSITEENNMGSGLSHYFEHMLGKRTNTRSTEQFYKEIRSMGGSDANAFTVYDSTGYHFTVHKEYIKNAIEAFSDIMKNSIFDDTESKKEIQVILKEFNLGDDNPYKVLWNTLMKTIYSVHPYRHPIIGYRDLFTKLGKDDILRYYANMYSPDNMIFVIVGDFDLDFAEECVREYFSDFERKSLKAIYIPDEPTQVMQRVVEKAFDINNTKVFIGYPTVGALSEDAPVLDLISIILAKDKVSRLHDILKEKLNIVYSIDSNSWTPKYPPGVFNILFELDYSNLQRVVSIIKDEIVKIQSEGFSDFELIRAKKIMKFSYLQARQTLSDYASSLSFSEFISSDPSYYYKRYIELVNNVRAEDIIRVAKKYLRHNAFNMVVLKPKNKLNYNFDKKHDSFSDETMLTKKNKNILLDKNMKNNSKFSSVEKVILNNGFTVLMKNDSDVPLVHINASFRGGFYYENIENQGIYGILTKLLMAGTSSRSKKMITNWVSDSGGFFRSRDFGDMISLNGGFNNSDFQQALDLYLDVLFNSIFPANELLKVKKDILDDIVTRDDDVISANYFNLMKFRYKGHSYGFDGLGTLETIDRITREDIVSLYFNISVPSNVIISVVGDFDRQLLLDKLSKFNSPNKGKFNLPYLKPPSSIDDKSYFLNRLKVDKKQSVVQVLFDGPDIYDEDSHIFTVLMHLFTGIGNRLYDDARGAKGLAYSTGAKYFLRQLSGDFSFYVLTEPEYNSVAFDTILKHVKLIKNKLISKDELKRAINSAVSSVIRSFESFDGFNYINVKSEILGLGFNYYYSLIDKFKMVTREDILRVAKKYFDLDKSIKFISQFDFK